VLVVNVAEVARPQGALRVTCVDIQGYTAWVIVHAAQAADVGQALQPLVGQAAVLRGVRHKDDRNWAYGGGWSGIWAPEERDGPPGAGRRPVSGPAAVCGLRQPGCRGRMRAGHRHGDGALAGWTYPLEQARATGMRRVVRFVDATPHVMDLLLWNTDCGALPSTLRPGDILTLADVRHREQEGAYLLLWHGMSRLLEPLDQQAVRALTRLRARIGPFTSFPYESGLDPFHSLGARTPGRRPAGAASSGARCRSPAGTRWSRWATSASA
jgi:hypothetical protein